MSMCMVWQRDDKGGLIRIREVKVVLNSSADENVCVWFGSGMIRACLNCMHDVKVVFNSAAERKMYV